MRSQAVLHVLIALLTGSVATTSFAYEWICPASVSIDASTPSVKDAPAGWEVSSHSDVVWLTAASLTSGRPAELAELKPETYRVDGKKYDWKLDKTDLEDRGIWFSCRYGNDRVLLSQRIVQSVTWCRLVTSKKQQQPGIKLECQ